MLAWFNKVSWKILKKNQTYSIDEEFYSNILESGFVTAALLSKMTKIQTENAKIILISQ